MTDDLGDDLDNWWGVCELIWKASFYKYSHLFDFCNQDWFAVASILENVLQLLKKEHPSITKAYLRSDEAGCYHNNFLICSIRETSHRTGISIEQYDFSEPQYDKTFATVLFVR